MEEMTEKFIGLEDAALHLGVKAQTVRIWIKDRGLPAYKIGKLLKFRCSEIDAWMQRGRVPCSSMKPEYRGNE